MKIENLRKEIEKLNADLELLENTFITDNSIKKIDYLQNEIMHRENAIVILEDNEIEEINEIIVSCIKWETDGAKVDLPKKITIPITLDNIELLEDIEGYADNVSDYISDTYGFLHNGFKLTTLTSREVRF